MRGLEPVGAVDIRMSGPVLCRVPLQRLRPRRSRISRPPPPRIIPVAVCDSDLVE